MAPVKLAEITPVFFPMVRLKLFRRIPDVIKTTKCYISGILVLLSRRKVSLRKVIADWDL